MITCKDIHPKDKVLYNGGCGLDEALGGFYKCLNNDN